MGPLSRNPWVLIEAAEGPDKRRRQKGSMEMYVKPRARLRAAFQMKAATITT